MSDQDPTDAEVVEAASAAAERTVFARYDKSTVRDLDVTVSYENGELAVDVYLNAEDNADDPQRVANDAALAARGAVDELLE